MNFLKKLWIATSCIGALFVSNSVLAATDHFTSVRCDNCTEGQFIQAAKGAYSYNTRGWAYVYDYVNRTYKGYYVYSSQESDGPHSPDKIWVEHASELTLSEDEINAMENILSALDIAYAQMSEFLTGSMGTFSYEYPDPNVTAKDFLMGSTYRNRFYDENFNTVEGTIAAVLNSAVEVVRHLTFAEGDIIVKSLSFPITFQDGSMVMAVINFTTGTTEIVPGSARDADGNTYPQSITTLPAVYEFRSQDTYHGFAEYVDWKFNGHSLPKMPKQPACIPILVVISPGKIAYTYNCNL